MALLCWEGTSLLLFYLCLQSIWSCWSTVPFSSYCFWSIFSSSVILLAQSLKSVPSKTLLFCVFISICPRFPDLCSMSSYTIRDKLLLMGIVFTTYLASIYFSEFFFVPLFYHFFYQKVIKLLEDLCFFETLKLLILWFAHSRHSKHIDK